MIVQKSMNFHNPYHFVPVSKKPGPDSVPIEDFKSRQLPSHLTHARYVSETVQNQTKQPVFSGRLVCRLESESPLVVGGEQVKQNDNDPTIVKPFMSGRNPAIPASSLRGLISSVAEAASNSALRVLEATGYALGPRRNDHPSAQDFFARVNPDLLPFGQNAAAAEKNDALKKQWLTIAELLFGFVEQRPSGKQPKNKESEKGGLAFASRLRPSLALPQAPAGSQDWWHVEGDGPAHNEAGEQWFTLKILGSPKPPSPALYFKFGCTAKKDLDLSRHQPQGRKFYLHHGENSTDWKTHPENEGDSLKQKMSVRPLRCGLTFWFHFDFDNLSEIELELLCYALRPSPRFRHKLGLGKPLGLGTVRIDPVGLFLVDREKRYGQDLLNAPRYHRVWAEGDYSQWPTTYECERNECIPARMNAPAASQLASQFRERMQKIAPEIIHALELLGDPKEVTAPVHYPQVARATGPNMEKRHFQWWVENAQQHQTLQPIGLEDQFMPLLPKFETQQGSRSGNRRPIQQGDRSRNRPR